MRRLNLFVTCLLIVSLSGCSVLMVSSRESNPHRKRARVISIRHGY